MYSTRLPLRSGLSTAAFALQGSKGMAIDISRKLAEGLLGTFPDCARQEQASITVVVLCFYTTQQQTN